MTDEKNNECSWPLALFTVYGELLCSEGHEGEELVGNLGQYERAMQEMWLLSFRWANTWPPNPELKVLYTCKSFQLPFVFMSVWPSDDLQRCCGVGCFQP